MSLVYDSEIDGLIVRYVVVTRLRDSPKNGAGHSQFLSKSIACCCRLVGKCGTKGVEQDSILLEFVRALRLYRSKLKRLSGSTAKVR